jgi:diguanylate cyclase (GGDEF)-like protein/PAS domain S-box-containing protein
VLEHAVALCLAEAEDMASALKAVIRAICETEGWECGQYWRLDETAGVLRFGEHWTVSGSKFEPFFERSRNVTFAPGVGLIGSVFQSGQPLWVADVTKDRRVLRSALVREIGLHSAFVFPVEMRGKLIGVLAFSSIRIREPDERLLQSIRVISSQIGQFLQRKRSEEEQHRFRAAMDASADMITLVDRETMRYIDVNQAACEVQGYTREEMLRLGPQDLSPLTREQLEKVYDETIATGKTSMAEAYHRRKDGTRIPVEIFRRAVQSGGRWIIVAMVRDLSERKRAEQVQRLLHSVTHSIAESESAAAAITTVIRIVCEALGWECGRYFMLDEKTETLRFGEAWGVSDPAIQQFIERSHEISYDRGVGLMGSAWQSERPIWVADVMKAPNARLAAFFADLGIHGAFVFPVIAEGKTIGVLAFNSRAVREPDDRLLQALRAIGTQIGQYVRRKRVEEDLRRFRVALDNSADMIVLIDRKTMRFIDVNETACRLLGYSKEELLQLGPQDVLPTTREQLERAYDEFIADPSTIAGMHSYYRCKDGSTFPFESTRRVIKSGDSHIIAAISRDISDRLASEDALRESEARFRGLTELSSDMYWEQDDQYRFTSIAGIGSERVNTQNFQLGKKRWEQNYVNMTADKWAEHIETLDGRRSFRDLELCRIADGGKKVWINVSGEPVFDKSGAFKGYHGVGKDITERKLAEERIQFLANHDALTALPNRAMFSEVLSLSIQHARRYQRGFSILFIDLDRFKNINDTLGHDAGDKLLQEMGTRLTQTVRASDVVARLGGDEFVILVQETSEAKQVAAVARKILSALVKPMFIGGQECRVTASIGVCMFPSDAGDEQTLMKNADIAMYRAKEDGKNNYKFYSDEINVHSFERLAMESSLRRALERNEFFLHYQAKLDLRTQRITGVEALVRWQHPDLGMVPPAQFIPIAEETGLIVAIGKWVLNAACAQSVAWQKDGLPPVRMAVNLSARQFTDDDLLSDIADAIETSGIRAELLELELTESMVIQNPERAGKVLHALKQMGVKLAIDDFGVGYSSLANLKRFPIDTLKVDRSFIRDIPEDTEDKAITEAIIAMGKSLNLTVVAEGVETLEQQTFLKERACDEMQGYFFSKPIPGEEFAALLRTRLQYQKP